MAAISRHKLVMCSISTPTVTPLSGYSAVFHTRSGAKLGGASLLTQKLLPRHTLGPETRPLPTAKRTLSVTDLHALLPCQTRRAPAKSAADSRLCAVTPPLRCNRKAERCACAAWAIAAWPRENRVRISETVPHRALVDSRRSSMNRFRAFRKVRISPHNRSTSSFKRPISRLLIFDSPVQHVPSPLPRRTGAIFGAPDPTREEPQDHTALGLTLGRLRRP